MFTNKTILITGGTGSFGNAVLKRLLKSSFKEIRIFSRDEKKQDDMRHRIQSPKVKFYIGDVRDKRSVDSAMYGVDFVFNGAMPAGEILTGKFQNEYLENVLLSINYTIKFEYQIEGDTVYVNF